MVGTIERFDHSLSAGGIVMIVIAAIGVLTAFTTIICLFVTSKKRSRVNQRLESATTRTVTSPRSASRPQNINTSNPSSPHVRTILPMFPELGEFSKYPPSYDEAMRMSAPTTPITPNHPNHVITPSGTPPPLFEEAQAHPLFSVVVNTPTPRNHLAPPTIQTNPLKNNDSTAALETISTSPSTNNSNNNENTK